MILLQNALLILALALVIDAFLGDPDWLWQRVPHPVVLFGRAISFLEKRWNTPPRPGAEGEWRGAHAAALLIAAAFGVGWLLQLLLLSLPFGWLWLAGLSAFLMAQKSLYQHVKRVENALELEGLAEARRAVSRLVGRNTQSLDDSAISRAAIESLAENYSDGVVAPALWFVLLGLPGLLAYKMLNTADSMIAHRTPRYRAFGWATAVADDWANWVPARVSAVLIALSAGAVNSSAVKAALVVKSDARKHRSPNAGWPEAAFAGALDIALSGPRTYATGPAAEPFIHPGGERSIGAGHIRRALTLFIASCGALFCVIFALGLVVAMAG